MNKRFQITLPAEVCDRPGTEPGDSLTYEILDSSIVLRRDPIDCAVAMLGLGAEIWQYTDVDEYIRNERDFWEKWWRLIRAFIAVVAPTIGHNFTASRSRRRQLTPPAAH